MSEPDKYDEMAEALLPCAQNDCYYEYVDADCRQFIHVWGCPVTRRPDVAAALREQGEEVAALKARLADYEHLAAAYGLQAKELEQAKLRLADAEKRGMETAVELISASEGDLDFALFIIRAEIEKLEGE